MVEGGALPNILWGGEFDLDFLSEYISFVPSYSHGFEVKNDWH